MIEAVSTAKGDKNKEKGMRPKKHKDGKQQTGTQTRGQGSKKTKKLCMENATVSITFIAY